VHTAPYRCLHGLVIRPRTCRCRYRPPAFSVLLRSARPQRLSLEGNSSGSSSSANSSGAACSTSRRMKTLLPRRRRVLSTKSSVLYVGPAAGRRGAPALPFVGRLKYASFRQRAMERPLLQSYPVAGLLSGRTRGQKSSGICEQARQRYAFKTES
jgi:hypothetical protein